MIKTPRFRSENGDVSAYGILFCLLSLLSFLFQLLFISDSSEKEFGKLHHSSDS